VGGDIPKEVRDHALGKVVAKDLVFSDEFLKFGGQADVPADDPPN
jgi:hypothetical protein